MNFTVSKNSVENLCEQKTIFYYSSLTVQLIYSVIFFLQLWYYNNQKIALCKHLFAQI